MVAAVNKVILIGYLGADPELRYLPNGKPTVAVSLATTESWKDKGTQEKKERTDWHRIVFFSGLAEIAADYLTTGSQIYVEGRLRNRKWEDKKGIERYTTEIIVDDLQMLGKAPSTEHPPINENPPLDNADDL